MENINTNGRSVEVNRLPVNIDWIERDTILQSMVIIKDNDFEFAVAEWSGTHKTLQLGCLPIEGRRRATSHTSVFNPDQAISKIGN